MTNYTTPRGAEWLADAAIYYAQATSTVVEFIADQFREISSPEDCKTTEELRAYARKVQRHSPSLAGDLLAAADRSDNERA